jgi:CubicO group peptidase (beta-lactamase class C family)
LVDPRRGARQIARVQQSDIDRAWKQLVAYASALMGKDGDREPIVPGLAIAVVWLPGNAAYAQGIGVRKVGVSSRPGAVDESNEVGPDTVFPLASVSKPISSTVMAMLMHEHPELSWSDVVPGLGSYRELFSHRTGLPDHAGDLLEDLGHQRADILRRLLLLDRNPVGVYAYTNFGLTAAAEHAAERVGTPWEKLAAKLYARLGMPDTSSSFDVFENRPNRTWGHVWRDGGWHHDVQRNPDQQTPAGGVTSTASDLSNWMKLQLGAQTWGEFPGLDVTHTPYEGDHGYALGWNATTRSNDETKQREVLALSHSGGFDLGAGTCVNLWPPHQLGVVALTNAAPIGVAEGLCSAFWRLVNDPEQTAARLLVERGPSHVRPEQQVTLIENFRAFMDMELRLPRRSNAVPAPGKRVADTFEFKGKYASEFYGEVEFDVKDGQLVMHMGPELRDRFVLSPTVEPNVSVFDSTGEFGATNNRVEFQKGNPDRVGIWNLLLSYPQELARDRDTRCPLSGVIRMWMVDAKRAARLALTVSRNGIPGFRSSALVDVEVGRNRFAHADLEVLVGDIAGLLVDGQGYSQVNTEDFEIAFDIDREGTFMACKPG